MSNASVARVNWDTSTNKDVFKTLVDQWFNSTDREGWSEWRNMFKDLKTKDEYERRGRWAGLDLPGAVGEGENIPIQTPKFGQVKDFTQASYGTGYRITDRMKKFEKIGLYEELTRNLAMNMEEGKDIEVAKMWNNLTSTTYNANSFDGFAIAYASHTCLDDASTTYDNYLDAALSHSSMESAFEYFDYMYDDQGNIFTVTPDTLYVNYKLRFTANEITQSDKKSGEMSNTKNVLPELSTFVYHRLTSTTAWGMLAKNHPKYGAFVYTSFEPDAIVGPAPDTTRDTIVHSLQYFTYGTDDPRMIYVGDT
jgi:hypothetical protein